MLRKLKLWAKKLKKEITALYYASQDDIGFGAKCFITITLAYALSPIDLIPDFIPVLGYLDDLIVLPILIMLSIYSIPENIMQTARTKAEEHPIQLKKNWLMAIIFILFWTLLLFSLYYVIT